MVLKFLSHFYEAYWMVLPKYLLPYLNTEHLYYTICGLAVLFSWEKLENARKKKLYMKALPFHAELELSPVSNFPNQSSKKAKKVTYMISLCDISI